MAQRKTFTRDQLISVLGANVVAQLDAKVAAHRSLHVPESDALAKVVATMSDKRMATTKDYYAIGRTTYVWLHSAENVPHKERLIAWCNGHITERQQTRIKEVQG